MPVKLIVAGNVVDVWEYEKLPVARRCEGSSNEVVDKLFADDVEFRRSRYRVDNSRRSRWRFIRLANSNFNDGDKFVTLTLGNVDFDKTDVRECNKRFRLAMRRLAYKFPSLVYLAVPEFTERGNVHYHVMMKLPYLPKKKLEEIWSMGFVKINRIKGCDNVGAYLSKYMSKQAGDDRMVGLKAYQGSKGLKKPTELCGQRAVDFLEGYGCLERVPVYGDVYVSDFHGLITYRQYNLSRV